MKKGWRALRALLSRKLTIVCDQIPYHFSKVPIKKILNWILVEASVLAKPGRPWGWPTHLQIEPTNRCNLSCALCPTTIGLDRPLGHMDLGLFQKLLDEAGDHVFLILLWDWGEPFMNPAVYDMVAYARAKGIKTVSSTNGQLFSRKDQAARLVASGLDSIIFALDGISQPTYQLYRKDGSLENVLQGIRNVVARKRELGSPRPLVNLRFIVMRENEHEIPRLKDLALSLGVDALTLKTLNPCNLDPYERNPQEIREQNPFLPRNPAYRRFKVDPSTGHVVRLIKNPCKQLWNNPVIHWNGTVCSCTYDVKDKFVLGDLSKQGFRDIWFGAPYGRMRRRFRREWEKMPLCSECSYAYLGGDCGRETIVEAHFFNP